ncbi:MAG: FIST N-terminal domain-containing protein [Pseudomonadota bacterium]
MKISAYSTTAKDFDTLLLADKSFVSIHMNCRIDPTRLGLNGISGSVHGATSCMGAMAGDGVTESIGVFAISDPDGAYGSAMLPYGDDAEKAASDATLAALQAADRIGEKPELIWLSGTPGVEEAVIAGIEAVVGPEVPVIGGSAADNSVSGEWFVFDKSGRSQDGLIVSVLFPSRPVSFAYHNGYAPTAKTGTVTKVEGRRLVEIDHQPALEVYDEWTNGAVGSVRGNGEAQSILSESTLFPLGRKVAKLGGVTSFLLAHPASACSSGAMELFATVEEGEELTQMSGTESGLVERAGRVASLARSAGHLEQGAISGALMVYCGGCMLSVRHRLDDIVDGVSDALGGAPFLGTFTFGEQGQILGAGNRHGNLMISCIIFG